jgi:hypothetical protein
MSSERRYNSKGKLIEELDIHLPYPSFKKVSSGISEEPNSNKSADLTNIPSKVEPELPPRFLKADEEEILAWCEAYLYLKKKGINIYRI